MVIRRREMTKWIQAVQHLYKVTDIYDSSYYLHNSFLLQNKNNYFSLKWKNNSAYVWESLVVVQVKEQRWWDRSSILAVSWQRTQRVTLTYGAEATSEEKRGSSVCRKLTAFRQKESQYEENKKKKIKNNSILNLFLHNVCHTRRIPECNSVTEGCPFLFVFLYQIGKIFKVLVYFRFVVDGLKK